MLTVYTFGDSILDCGHYNHYGIHPGGLLVRNNDALFPAFQGQDLATQGPVRLEQRAQDGATLAELPAQMRGLTVTGPALALLTIGGNDLLMGLMTDRGRSIDDFAHRLDELVRRLPIRPLLVGNVYDPTFGDDSQNFLGIDPTLARANHRRLNSLLAEVAARCGVLVDLHAHFLTGAPFWFTHTIEPSLHGASEVRRTFLPHVLTHAAELAIT